MSDDVNMVCVGGQRVGIIGLQTVFKEVKAQGAQSDEQVQDELIARVKKKNYIPPSAQNEYAAALAVDAERALFHHPFGTRRRVDQPPR